LKNLVIIGGGAAGFMAAITAAERKVCDKIIILEKGKTLLNKVKISGGGRCNVTHNAENVEALINNYPRGKNFLKKSFYIFNNSHTKRWFEKRNVPLITESDNRIFPKSNNSETIVQCLLQEALKHRVIIQTEKYVKAIIPQNQSFQIVLRDGDTINAEAVMIACGGFQRESDYDFIKKLNHKVISPVPSLFSFNMPDENTASIMGISIKDAEVKILGTKIKSNGSILFTHWGLSGPAILRTSAFSARILHEKNYHFEIQINWLPSLDHEVLRQEFEVYKRENSKINIKNWNGLGFPKRFWLYILQRAKINENTEIQHISDLQIEKLIRVIQNDIYKVAGKTTFKEEFVTCGGVDLQEINPTTMESKIHKNLFFGGEIMDVDGVTGGFNFQHAWTSGFLCGNNVFS